MTTIVPPFLTDAEIDAMCAGLTQPAARVRYLRGLGLRVDRKPNGQPLAWRPAAVSEPAQNAEPAGIIVGLQDWAARRTRNGTKA